jgi:hypothetical protein
VFAGYIKRLYEISDQGAGDGARIEYQQALSRRLNPHEGRVPDALAAPLRIGGDATGVLERFASLAETSRPRYDRGTFLDINKLVIVNLALRLGELIATRSIPDEILLM